MNKLYKIFMGVFGIVALVVYVTSIACLVTFIPVFLSLLIVKLCGSDISWFQVMIPVIVALIALAIVSVYIVITKLIDASKKVE